MNSEQNKKTRLLKLLKLHGVNVRRLDSEYEDRLRETTRRLKDQVGKEKSAERLTIHAFRKGAWQDATYKRLAEYVLLRCWHGDSYEVVAFKLEELEVPYSKKQVGNFVRAALDKVAHGSYDPLALKPKKRGPRSRLKYEICAHLAKLKNYPVEAWRFWTLPEITFFLQTGYCPPYLHNAFTEVAAVSEHFRLVFDGGWVERAVSHYQDTGELTPDMSRQLKRFSAALKKTPRKFRNYGLVHLELDAGISRGPNPEYVRQCLNARGYYYHTPPFVRVNNGNGEGGRWELAEDTANRES